MLKPGKYVHFKGKEYELLYTAKHSETQEEIVVYKALYGEKGIWVRPSKMWEEMVNHENGQVKRFTFLSSMIETYFGIIYIFHKLFRPSQTCSLLLNNLSLSREV